MVRLWLTLGSFPLYFYCSFLRRGDIAQLGERLHGMQEVGGSSPPISTTRPLTPVFLVLGLTSSRGTWHSFSENLQWITMFGERILRIETPGGDLRQFALRYRRAQTMATLCTCGTMALWMHGTISL